MFKKHLVIMSLLGVCAHSALAGTAGKIVPRYNYRVGPYVGVSGGVITNFSCLPGALVATYNGIEGQVSAGWGHLNYQNIYIGGEFFGGTSAISKNMVPHNKGIYSVKSTWGYGFDLMPGLLINDLVLGYLRIGVNQLNFPDLHTTPTGYRLGLGGQTNVYKNLDLRAEYVFNQYKPSGVINHLGGINRLDAELFNIGIVYKFV